MVSPSTGRLLLVAAVILLGSSAATSAFNITTILGAYPGFEQFNQLLSRTHLAEEINSRRTITVLGLPNERLASIMQMTEDAQKSILSLHVILDYFDMIKLNSLPLGSKTVATNLYQTTGLASDQQGFINIFHRQDGTFAFGSAMQGAPLVSMLVNSVVTQPFNISVLSVSRLIIAPGMDGFWLEPMSLSPPSQTSPPPKAFTPVPAPTPAPAPRARKTLPPAADKPGAAEPPADASAPAPSPSGSPSPAPAEEPPADEYHDELDAEEEKKKSGALIQKGVVSGVTVWLVIGLASFLASH